MRWAEARERVLLTNGKPKRTALALEDFVATVPTLAEFAPRFLEGYAQANRQKPSGIAAKETALRVHLLPQLGDKRLDKITTEAVAGNGAYDLIAYQDSWLAALAGYLDPIDAQVKAARQAAVATR